MVNIEGLSRAKILATLYNNSKTLFPGNIHYTSDIMTEKDAEEILNTQSYFNHLNHRIIKIDFSDKGTSFGKEINERLYDSYNGIGKTQELIDCLRKLKLKIDADEFYKNKSKRIINN